jgi:hypothetical protein
MPVASSSASAAATRAQLTPEQRRERAFRVMSGLVMGLGVAQSALSAGLAFGADMHTHAALLDDAPEEPPSEVNMFGVASSDFVGPTAYDFLQGAGSVPQAAIF